MSPCECVETSNKQVEFNPYKIQNPEESYQTLLHKQHIVSFNTEGFNISPVLDSSLKLCYYFYYFFCS